MTDTDKLSNKDEYINFLEEQNLKIKDLIRDYIVYLKEQINIIENKNKDYINNLNCKLETIETDYEKMRLQYIQLKIDEELIKLKE
tara:strand:- start:252 stop:509 length:258 start_codon:yes stop_codon:yes gene_type:complete